MTPGSTVAERADDSPLDARRVRSCWSGEIGKGEDPFDGADDRRGTGPGGRELETAFPWPRTRRQVCGGRGSAGFSGWLWPTHRPKKGVGDRHGDRRPASPRPARRRQRASPERAADPSRTPSDRGSLLDAGVLAMPGVQVGDLAAPAVGRESLIARLVLQLIDAGVPKVVGDAATPSGRSPGDAGAYCSTRPAGRWCRRRRPPRAHRSPHRRRPAATVPVCRPVRRPPARGR